MALMQQTSMKFVWAGSQRCWGWVYAHMGVYIYLMHTGIPARQLGCHAQFAEGSLGTQDAGVLDAFQCRTSSIPGGVDLIMYVTGSGQIDGPGRLDDCHM